MRIPEYRGADAVAEKGYQTRSNLSAKAGCTDSPGVTGIPSCTLSVCRCRYRGTDAGGPVSGQRIERNRRGTAIAADARNPSVRSRDDRTYSGHPVSLTPAIH